jgi:hypothetical protein
MLHHSYCIFLPSKILLILLFKVFSFLNCSEGNANLSTKILYLTVNRSGNLVTVPAPARSFGSSRLRLHNTASLLGDRVCFVLISMIYSTAFFYNYFFLFSGPRLSPLFSLCCFPLIFSWMCWDWGCPVGQSGRPRYEKLCCSGDCAAVHLHPLPGGGDCRLCPTPRPRCLCPGMSGYGSSRRGLAASSTS